MPDRASVLEDHDAIRERVAEIFEKERVCPKNGMRLYECLRTSSPCSADCAFRERYKGPFE